MKWERGYRVSLEDALKILGQERPAAADWWVEHVRGRMGHLIFQEEVCEEIL